MDFEDLTAGDEVVSRTIDDIRAEEIKLGVSVVQDQNPIHFDERMARAAERPGLINLGPINMAYVMQGVLAVAPTPGDVVRFRVRFRDNVFEGETVVVTATVGDKRHEDGDRLVDLDLALEKGNGSTAVSGVATVRFPDL